MLCVCVRGAKRWGMRGPDGWREDGGDDLHVRVLAVNHGGHTVLPRSEEDIQNLAVVQLQRRERHVNLSDRPPRKVSPVRNTLLPSQEKRKDRP